MAGIIDSVMEENPTKDAPDIGTLTQATSTGINPQQRTIDQAKETVSGQLDALLKADSPYLQQARAGADQTANQRGLLNSSIAAGAGEAAAINAALPIANADASVYGTAARDNQAATNTALQFNAESKNKTSLVNADAANQNVMQQLRGDQALKISTIDNEYRNLIQTNALAANMYNSLLSALTTVSNSSTMDSASKQQAADNFALWLESGLGIIGGVSGYNLQSLLTFN